MSRQRVPLVSPAAPADVVLGQLDQMRRRTGRLLDALGAGPRVTPSRTKLVAAGVSLHAYTSTSGTGPAVLLVPAPIKRSYIWDLEPEASVVLRCVRHGFRVYLVEWADPGPDEQKFGLDEYADRLLVDCIQAVAAETGERRVQVIGHSLGGTLAAIGAALHPELVARIVLLESPLHFGPDAGAFGPLVAASPRVAWARSSLGGVHGSLLDIVSAVAAPVEFQFDRYADLVRCLGDWSALARYLRVVRWTLDEFTLPGQLFEEIVERLYRRDEFMRGTLAVNGRCVGPAELVVPMLNVVDPRSAVIPPRSIVPFHNAAAASRKKLLEYDGDIGVVVQHVGVLVGQNAHRELWPVILRWLDERTAEGAAREAADMRRSRRLVSYGRVVGVGSPRWLADRCVDGP